MSNKIEINLLPAEYRVHSVRIKISREIFIPSLILVLCVAVMTFWTLCLNNQIGSYKKKIEITNQEIKKNQHILEKINALKARRELVQMKIRALERINVDREKWVRLQEMFCQKLPEVAWLEKIYENKDSSNLLIVEGKTYAFSEVAQYMSRLEKGNMLTSVDLDKIEEVNGSEKIFSFILRCIINPDARLNDVVKE